jgi:hypothetical protein
MKTALNRIFPSTAPAASSEAPADGVTAPPPGVERACPECGSAAAPDQDWCLECGARIEQPRAKWQQPVAIMASVALIFIAAIALALSEVAKDAEIAKAKTVKRYVAAPPPPAATTPPAPSEPTPSDDSTTPDSSKNPTDDSLPSDSSTDTGSSSDPGTTDDSTLTDPGFTDTSGGGYIPPPSGGGTDTTPTPPTPVEWPSTKKAWTVVLLTTTSKDDASDLAIKARDDGVPAGILQSDNYKNLSSGLWLVWAGRFGTEDEAYAAATGYAGKGYDGESVEYIRRKAADDTGSGTDNGSSDGSTDTTDTTDTTDGG